MKRRIAVLITTAWLGAAPVAGAQPLVLPARPASEFVNSVGVNTHVNYLDTAYGNYEKVIRPRLIELGIRHIRDGAIVDAPIYVERLQDLGRYGIRAQLIATPGFVEIGPALDLAARLGEVQEAIEGPNEYDNGKDPAQWVPTVRQYQRDLFLAARRRLPRLSVVGPSFVSPEATRLVGNLAPWCDLGNLHPYTYPNPPLPPAIGADLALRRPAFVGPTRPMVATEAGFPTGAPGSDRPVPEATQAVYLLRTLLVHFDLGIIRTYLYELIDQKPEPQNRESNFGLLRFDGTPKPAFVAIRRMLASLQEPERPGRRPAPILLRQVTFRVDGGGDDLDGLLLQKQSGALVLALWRNVAFGSPPRTFQITPSIPVRNYTITNPNADGRASRQDGRRPLRVQIADTPVFVTLTRR